MNDEQFEENLRYYIEENLRYHVMCEHPLNDCVRTNELITLYLTNGHSLYGTPVNIQGNAIWFEVKPGPSSVELGLYVVPFSNVVFIKMEPSK